MAKATPVPSLAADYSFARPSVSALEHDDGVLRYVSHDPGKNLTVQEAKELRAAGKWIALVWEDAANRAAQGHAAGVADATEANRQADALGYPKDAVIFYAVDFDATPGQVQPYFDGAKSVPGSRPVGAYGSSKITGIKLTSYNWQTSAWSGGLVDGSANLYQRQKPTHPVPGCDENVLLNPFPAWGLVQHKSPTFPHIVRALRSNARHAKDLEAIKNKAAKVVARVALAALRVEARRLTRIVKKG